jgi:alcohol/geraniol dehydrogenase (NADP+)
MGLRSYCVYSQRFKAGGSGEAWRRPRGFKCRRQFNRHAFIGTPAPSGRLHIIGAVLEPIPIAAFDLIMSQRVVTGSPTGSPVMMAKMLEFAARHKILPTVEHFPMSRINDAIAHLIAGKARYRVVLDADFK